jgi:hypothetical protein
MHKIMSKKFYLGPKFGTLFNKKWITISELLLLEPHTKLKDVQKFAGCLASLSRFVSRLGEKARPLYQLMKKTDHFVWSQRADDAFNNLKPALSTAPILAAPAS